MLIAPSSSSSLRVLIQTRSWCPTERRSVCLYSFASTEHYLILVLAPCVISPLKMLINKSFFSDVQWKPQNGVKFYVVDKRKGGPGHVATFRLVRFSSSCCDGVLLLVQQLPFMGVVCKKKLPKNACCYTGADYATACDHDCMKAYLQLCFLKAVVMCLTLRSASLSYKLLSHWLRH